ncbi:zinc knuckle [Colletotrichum limetticola]|uniref:Zinc knuckle n=1 Tax=Colletotrichum limetticola TaxID=1209924 RepID=A0ABQ9P7G5_9PEZI|nr:zinc knuckle [Colletotrichum limetticola]
MDSALKWKQHIDKIERKVKNTVTALSSLDDAIWGVMMREMRTIHKAIAIPQIMYACSLWFNSSWGEMGYRATTMNRLQRLQARAARAMYGAYRSTSYPALDMETYLLPAEQQLWKHNIGTISRVAVSEQHEHEHEHISPFITLHGEEDGAFSLRNPQSMLKRNTDDVWK